jgi:hypothetical protein
LCYQSDSLLIWVILEDQNEKCYRDAYEEQKRHVEIYKKNADVLKQNNTSQLKKISLLQDKLDSSAGSMLTSKKECDRLTKEIYIIKNERDKATSELVAQNQIEYNKLTKELFICQTEKSELIEEIKIYMLLNPIMFFLISNQNIAEYVDAALPQFPTEITKIIADYARLLEEIPGDNPSEPQNINSGKKRKADEPAETAFNRRKSKKASRRKFKKASRRKSKKASRRKSKKASRRKSRKASRRKSKKSR